MTFAEELELLAKDCEETAREAQQIRSDAEARAWMAIAARIRHAAKRLSKD